MAPQMFLAAVVCLTGCEGGELCSNVFKLQKFISVDLNIYTANYIPDLSSARTVSILRLWIYYFVLPCKYTLDASPVAVAKVRSLHPMHNDTSKETA